MLGQQLFGVFSPGGSPIHRSPLWVKFLGLLVLSVILLLTAHWWVALACLLAAVLLGKTAGIPATSWVKTLRPMYLLLAILAVYYLFMQQIFQGLDVILTMVTLVIASHILLKTTPIPQLIDGFVKLCKPLKLLGVSPERIGLSIALMVRSIPVIMDEYTAIQQAHQARGISTWPHKLLIPLVLATVAYAQETGDALAARGLDS